MPFDIERRKEAWNELDQAVARLRTGGARSLSRVELKRIGRLYRQAAADLAYIRTKKLSPELDASLNALMTRAHGVIYRARTGTLRIGLRNFWDRFALSFRMTWRLFAAAIGFFFVGAVVAFALCYHDGDWTYRLMPEQFADVVEQWKSGEQKAVGKDDGYAPTAFYFVNNTSVAMRCFGYGILLGIPTVVLLIQNGAIMGALAAEMAKVGKLGYLLVSIFPHGVPELGAIFLCGAGGLALGLSLLLPGDRTRIDSVRHGGKTAIWLLAGSVPLLLWAALTEGFFSFYAFPNYAKALFGVAGLVVLSVYFMAAGRASTPHRSA